MKKKITDGIKKARRVIKKSAKKITKKIRAEKAKRPKKMLKKDMKIFKELLLKLKEEIVDQIRHLDSEALRQSQRDAAGDISGYTIHMADVATDTYDREFSIGLASNDRELLYQIDEALKRIDDGTYGICAGGNCGKLIAKNRLKAVPYTRLCMKCQAGLETK
jgi:RNA polymerase-binding protein DksA